MLKKILLITAVLSMAYGFFPVTARAESEYQAPRVTVRIEGASRRYAAGEAEAYTFREALEALAAANGLTLTYVQSGPDAALSVVESPDGGVEPEHYPWFAYIRRGGQLIKHEHYLDLPLENGDEAVAYQGGAETLALTELNCDFDGGESALRFFAGVSEVIWAETDGLWAPNVDTTPAGGVNIHLTLPDGEYTAISGEDGYAAHILAQPGETALPGAVCYYAEGYRENAAPLIVRTAEEYAAYGFGGKYVTRAEAAAFFVNMANNGEYRSPETAASAFLYTDVNAGTAYADAIAAATALGYVEGCGEGLFLPDELIDLKQLCVLAARVFPETPDGGAAARREITDEPPFSSLPEWAYESVIRLYAAGCLSGAAFDAPVTPEELVGLYKSISREGL